MLFSPVFKWCNGGLEKLGNLSRVALENLGLPAPMLLWTATVILIGLWYFKSWGSSLEVPGRWLKSSCVLVLWLDKPGCKSFTATNALCCLVESWLKRQSLINVWPTAYQRSDFLSEQDFTRINNPASASLCGWEAPPRTSCVTYLPHSPQQVPPCGYNLSVL